MKTLSLILSAFLLSISTHTAYSQTSDQEVVSDLRITEVELSPPDSENGNRAIWVEVHNPAPGTVSTPLEIRPLGGEFSFLSSSATFDPGQYAVFEVWHISNPERYPDTNTILVLYAGSGEVDRTPALSDTFADSRTWQLDGTEWVFAEKSPGRPPFTYPTEYLDPLRRMQSLSDEGIDVRLNTRGIFKSGDDVSSGTLPTIFNGTEYAFDVFFTRPGYTSSQSATLQSVDYNVLLMLDGEEVLDAARDSGQARLHAPRAETTVLDVVYGITDARFSFDSTGNAIVKVIVYAVNSDELGEPAVSEFAFLVDDSHRIPEFGPIVVVLAAAAMAGAMVASKRALDRTAKWA